MRPIKVRLDWMEPGDYVTGFTFDVGWNGFPDVWLSFAAVYALDRAAWDVPSVGGLFEPASDDVPYLEAVPEKGHIFRLSDTSADGERSFLPERLIDGQPHWDFSGWTFSEVTE